MKILKKYLPFLLMAGGLVMVGAACWQIWHTGHEERVALAEAKMFVTETEKQQISFQNWKPEVGKTVGVLVFPSLQEKLPVLEGTSDDVLARGVGHYQGTAFPGGRDQIVFSGHRDTVFDNLGRLDKGDEIQVEMAYGTFTYTVDHTQIVGADNRTVIHSTAPKEVLTLTTCYPFNYIGHAPRRYIVYALPKNG